MSKHAKNSQLQIPRKKMLVEELEQRIMYSADAAAGLLDTNQLTPNVEVHVLETVAASADTTTEAASTEVILQHELVIVDTNVQGYQTFIDDILANRDDTKQIEVLLLDNKRDGIEQISEILSNYDDVSAIHLVGEGTEAELHLGSSFLTLDSINNQYAESLKEIGNHLTENADILIYGCNFGQGEHGLEAVEAFGDLTGADIAASDDRTGHATEFADWELEIEYGTIETAVFLSAQGQANWTGALSTYTVTNTNDNGANSLRAAITSANANAGFDNIVFNIPGAGTHTITLLSELPELTDVVLIDGFSEPDYVVGTPAIELNGNGVALDGFRLAAGSAGSTIQGFIINNFTGDGIDVDSSNNTIIGNWIGLDNTGLIDQGNGEDGVDISNSGNTIGGTTLAERNVISGNNINGVYITGASATNNSIIGNYIGTNITGIAPIGNSFDGIKIISTASSNTIGGTNANERNIISGNNDEGIELSNASNNSILGNYIGTDVTGTVALGNADHGIVIFDGASGNTVGGNTTGARNIIAANTANGIVIAGNGGSTTDNNMISGNYIGTDVTGNTSLGNGLEGINIIDGADNNTIGGATAAHGNVITGNLDGGIGIYNEISDSNTIQNNLIGVNADGLSAPGNIGNGVFITGGADATTILDNHIAGNTVIGVEIDGASSNTTIQGNIIGTDATGTLNWGHQQHGVLIENGGFDNLIGSTNVGEGNTIAFNGVGGVFTAGVLVKSGTGNAVLGNAIYSNVGIGLDLGTAGVTTNDLNDVDGGANNLQNFPQIASAITSGTEIKLSGILNSITNTAFRIEFFSNTAADPSGNGEGETYLGYVNATTDAGGNLSFNTTLTASVAAGLSISATATNLATNDTSEFAANVVAATGNTVTGTIYEDVDGDGGVLDDGVTVQNAAVSLYLDDGDGVIDAGDTFVSKTLTDASGNYTFGPVASGTYWVVVDSTSVVASNGLNATFSVGDTWADQSYGSIGAVTFNGSYNYQAADGVLYGGLTAGVSDNATSLTTAQHINRVIVAGTDITGVDYGFSFNVITNTNDTAAVDPFTDVNAWTSFDPGSLGVGTDPVNGYSGNIYDGRYIYYVPTGVNSNAHGEVLRYDTHAEYGSTTAWTAFDPSANGVGIDADGYDGAVFDGRYIYFTPENNGTDLHGEVLRFDTQGDFETVSSWTTFDPGANGVGIDPDGYREARFDGRYIYFSPNTNGTNYHSEVLRYDTLGTFNNVASWDTFDPLVAGVTTEQGYDGIEFDGRYMYFVPLYNGTNYHGEVVRYDTQAAFGNAASWEAFDPGDNGVGVDPDGYNGAVFDGQYIYFVPFRADLPGNQRTGEVLRYDTTATFGSAAAWDTFDPGANGVGISADGFIEATFDGNYIYFVPLQQDGGGDNGEVLRYDVQGAFNSTASWTAFNPDTNGIGTNPIGLTGAITVGQYVYYSSANPTEEFLRFDTAYQVDGQGSLRQFIDNSNAIAGIQSSQFAILSADTNHFYYADDGVAGQVSTGFISTTTEVLDTNIVGIDVDHAYSWYSFVLGTTLPEITDTVVIDGYTQNGAQANTLTTGSDAILKIELDGTSAGAVDGGLDFIADNNTVSGLIINNFNGDGVQTASASSGNTIAGNYVGTDASGTIDLGNTEDGIDINGSNNVIGGLTPAARNLISGNDTHGIDISGDSNTVQGNYIGTDVTGTVDLGNDNSGIILKSANNTIGGTAAGARNVISGNDDDGVLITGATAIGNSVQGNYIGTDATGLLDVGNTNAGVTIALGAQNNTIGGTTSNEGNLISGNNASGINIANAGTNFNVVESNLIGTDVTGTLDLGNSNAGVIIHAGAQNNTIGSINNSNVISGNDVYGVYITGVGTDSNTIASNYIGTDITGTQDLGNANVGVFVQSSAANNVIGGGTGKGNIISGNDDNGIELNNATGTTVQGNFIGVDATGSTALGNSLHGISIWTSDGNTIGGAGANEHNVIGGNGSVGGQGILIYSSDNNVIQGNYIGTDVTGTVNLANADNGITFSTSAINNLIGGDNPNEGNTIAFNTKSGISASASTKNNAILGNAIYSNTLLGIDLQSTGVTNNDAEDVDAGANDLLNFPVITNVQQLGPNLGINFDLDLSAGNYRIEFFDNAGGLDASGFGEGQTFIGFVNITTTGIAGYESFGTTLTGVTASSILNITTTATVNLGGGNYASTSEFGPQFTGTGVLEVDTTSDVADGDTSSIAALLGNRGADGFISLSEAITATNNTAGADVINFNIFANDARHFYYADDGVAGQVSTGFIGTTTQTLDASIIGIDPDYVSSWYSIQPGSALPTISDALTIDGYSQTGAQENTLATGTDAIIKIEIDGSIAGLGTDGLTVAGFPPLPNTIKGLVVNQFDDYGIALLSGSNHVITGNYIGTDVSGTLDLGNGSTGLHIDADDVTVGGTTAAARNVLSGNDAYGINLNSATGGIIQGNYIGTNAAGNAAIGNTIGGVLAQNSTGGNTIGGTAPGAGNLISGSANYGIGFNNSDNNIVQSNLIGTDATGLLALGNATSGVFLTGGSNSNTIGGNTDAERNIIADSGNDNILINLGSSSNTISGNYIGADINGNVLGSSTNGIRFNANSDSNIIGGTGIGEGNLIVGNGTGIQVSDPNSNNNAFLSNTIHSNTGLGIDLGSNGVTLNDVAPLDPDTGANSLQNFPVITSAATDGAGTINIVGSLNSTASTVFRIEYFASSIADGSGHGEAVRYLGFAVVGTNISGDASINSLISATVAAGEFITATATVHFGGSNYGDTSEFAANFVATTQAPTANNDGPALVFEGGTSTFDLAVNDTDPDDGLDLASIVIVSNPTNGSIVVNANGSVDYTHDGSETTSDSFTYTIKDNGGNTSNIATVSVTVFAVNDAPSGADKTVSTNEDADYVFTSADFGFTDTSDTIANNFLNVFLTTVPTTGTLYLDSDGDGVVDGGEAFIAGNTVSVADIDLSRLKFKPAPDANGLAYDSFTFQVQDDGGTAGGGVDTDQTANTITIDVTAANDAPVFSALNGTPTFTEDGLAVVLDSDVQIFDAELNAADNYSNASFTLRRNSGPDAEDLFSETGNLAALTEGGNLVLSGVTIGTVTTNSAGTLVLTFNANATQARVNETLQSIAYSNNNDVPPASVDISWIFNDNNAGSQGFGGAGIANGSTIVTIFAVNDAPVVTPTAAPITFQGTLQPVDTGIVITDADDTQLVGATISITSGYLATEDVLIFTNKLGITGSYNAGTGVLTLTGTTTVANYQAAIRTVFYDNTEAAPDATTRTISFVVDDGTDTSVITTRDININVNKSPLIDAPLFETTPLNTTLTFSGGNGNQISISDADGGTVEITLTIANGTLSLNGITGLAFTTGDGAADATMTFSGTIVDINNALNGMFYTPLVAYNGAATLQILVDDLANGGGIARVDSTSTFITVGETVPLATDDPQDFNTEIAALNPLSYWRLGDAGITATDGGTAGVDGTLVGGVLTGQPGPLNGDADTAVQFDGVDDYISIPHATDYELDNGTVQFWFKADAIGGLQGLFSKDYRDFGDGGHAGIWIDNAGNIQARIQSADADYYTTSSTTVNVGQWHHVAFSFGSNGMELYVDGTLSDVNGYTGGLATTSGGLGNFEPIVLGTMSWISNPGALDNLTNFFQGAMDEVSIVDSQLTAEQIQNIVASGFQNYTIAENTSLNVIANEGVLINDSDADADPLTAVLVSGPSNAASFTLNADGSFNYTPIAGFDGTDTFTYQANDGANNSNIATVTITVTGSNDAPTATNLNAGETYTEDTPLNLIDIVVTDVDNANTTVTLTLSDVGAGALSTATSGLVTSTFIGGVWTATGAVADVNALLAGVTFNPTLNYDLNFNIATSVNDGIAPAVTGTKVMTAIPVNDAPVAIDDRTALDFDGTDDYVLIANDPSLVMTSTLTIEAWIKSDDNTRPLEQLIVNKEGEYEIAIKNGTIQWGVSNTDPGWIFHDTGYAIATDTWTHVAFTYDNGVANTYVNGALVDSYSGSGAIVDTYPALNDLLIGGRLNNPVGKYFDGQIADVRVWDTARTQLEISLNLGVVLTGAETGLKGYWLLNEGAGTTTVDSSTQSNDGLLGGGVVTQEPSWADYTIAEDGTLNITAPGILANDFDVDGDTLTVNTTPIVDVSNGTLTLNSDGSFIYIADADFNGIDSFTYEISDGNSGTDTAVVTINVTPVNDAPTATNLSAAETYTEDTPLNLIDIVVTDVDNANTTVTLTLSDVGAGALSTATSGLVTSTFIGGVWTATGAVADVNALLAGVTFNPTLNYDLNFNIATSVTDGVAPAVTGTKIMTAIPVNDAPIFGVGDGIVTTPIGSANDYAQNVTIQTDGKILVTGQSFNGLDTDFTLTRYNTDGSLDISFGTGGIVNTAIGLDNDFGSDVTVQVDGKILVTGSSYNGTNYDFALVRYNADGTLDTSFSGDGMLTTAIGLADEYGRSVTVQADGKIIVGGFTFNGTNNDLALVRYNVDGTLDASFDGDGILTTAVGPGDDLAFSVIVQADGKILLAGNSHNGANDDIMLVRYNTNGTLDASFSVGGILTLDIGGGTDLGDDITLQADGKILLTGAGFTSTHRDLVVVRINTDGTLDASFGTGGIVTTDVGAGHEYGNDIKVQTNGKIVVSGASNNGVDWDLMTVRYNADGTLDASFSSDGKVVIPLGPGNDYGIGAAIQSDGKIIVSGQASNGSDFDFVVLRYNADGSLDTTFDSGLLNGNPTFTEGGPAVVLDTDVTIFDAELSAANDFNGATLTLIRNLVANAEDVFSATGNLAVLTESGNLVLSGITIGTVTTNSAGTLVLTFNANATQARVNETLQSIAYSNSSDAPPASVQIDWTFNDGNIANAQGTGGDLEDNGSTTVTIIPANDAPINNVPGAQTVNEDTSLVFDSANFNLISIADSDAGTNPLRVTLTATNGLITLSQTTGLTFTTGNGTANTTMVFEGTLTDINAALDGLSFLGDLDFNGAANIQITTDDLTITSLNEDSNLQGFYTFDNTGDLGNDDSVGGANDGTVNGAITINDATRGNVLSFDGNDNVQVSGFLGSPGDVTLAAWINLDAGFVNEEVISLGDNVVLRAHDSFLQGFVYDGATWKGVSASFSLGGTGWHHVAYAFDDTSNTQTLYIDGIAVATDSPTYSISYSLNTDTSIGAHPVLPTHSFHGKIDDARIYSRALTATEIQNIAFETTSTDTDNIAITVTPINDAPTATNLNAGETYTEDTPLNLIDIVVTDVDNANTTVTLTLSDLGAGTLSTATSGLVTSTFVGGVWTATGAVADVNALLAGVTFNPTLNYDLNFNIATSVSDSIAPAVTGTKVMTAIPVNDAPTATNLNAGETYTEDTPLNLIDIVVTDVDNANTTVTLTLSDLGAGTLSTATSGLVTSTFVGGVWTATG
ncbi:MAG: LamG-like jellyroll fold domain-containing protein, partial [Methylophilaceae bacterium]